MFGRSRAARQVDGGQRLRPTTPAPASASDQRLEQMFVAHHAMVWRTLRRRGLTADAAADAAQQTFLVAAERLDDIQPDSERAFLVGTALRVARSMGRKTLRWQLEEDMDRRVVAAQDHAAARAAVELCDLALSNVDPDVAEVFVLFELEGLSSPEIAASLEIPLGTVASRLRRAREQFRRVVSRLETAIRREGAP
ncbi:MAG TPA: sigma-70 family RNA polymerase sigma factor [Polyangia bacterium]|nr:sigma-70 family RNA polymerase sigma factor [Polyangia bacterium]